ncbi:hypothetical protein RvY_03032 [Ramazzottius varieornatus]|uniref:Reverse transcriptase domain-containing protein n=1 Tax=Ramazzottius varieornatus TaxID=947166 RepID=A0A1D1UW74_RAMVA|nr:hypothetical protein RvY_03032 [Ramazzottius varieornatus]
MDQMHFASYIKMVVLPAITKLKSLISVDGHFSHINNFTLMKFIKEFEAETGKIVYVFANPGRNLTSGFQNSGLFPFNPEVIRATVKTRHCRTPLDETADSAPKDYRSSFDRLADALMAEFDIAGQNDQDDIKEFIRLKQRGVTPGAVLASSLQASLFAAVPKKVRREKNEHLSLDARGLTKEDNFQSHLEKNRAVARARTASLAASRRAKVSQARIRHVPAAIPKPPKVAPTGGPDGLRPQHLKDLLGGLRDPMSLQLAQALADLVGLMLDGKVPEDVCPTLYGASLIALLKKTGGIRPIAVGNTLRRLAGKIVSKRVMEATGKLIRHQQLGYGTRSGAEAAVHFTRAFLSGQTGCQTLLKLDFRDAFNSVHRDRLLEEVQKFLPEGNPFIFQMYRSPTNLIYGEHVIPSARGVQQGDPLGPLLFCLLTRNLSKSLQSPFNVWYLDDSTLGGDFELVSRDFQTIVEIGACLGLELNTSKFDFVVCGGTLTQQQVTRQKMKLLCPGVMFPDKETLTLLGAPVFPEAIPPVLEKKIRQAELMTTRLEKISAHQSLFLSKNCLSLPKLLYILRCSPTFSCLASLQAFDETIRKCAGKIANIAMDDTV